MPSDQTANILQKLKKLVIGSTSDDLQKVNKSINKLKKSSGTKFKFNQFNELIKSLVSGQKTSFEDILKQVGVSFQSGGIDQQRLSRYKEYENIIEKIPYMKRAIKVLVQNILKPEDYTKESLKVRLFDDDVSSKVYKDTIENIIKTYIDDELDHIVFSTLLYGDYFAEIVVVDNLLKKYNLLSEDLEFESNDILAFKTNNGSTKIRVVFESNILKEDNNANSNKKNKTKNFFIKYHNPDKVIKLGDDIELGYLVINGGTELTYVDNNTNIDDQVINNLVNTIMIKLKNNVKLKDELKTKDELKEILAKLLVSSKVDEIKIRYVQPDLMQHFVIDKSIAKLRPYGASVLYGSEFLAKIIIAIQGSIMVQRLTRSVDRQLIYVDIGASRDVRTYINAVRDVLQKKKFTVDGLSIDEIPAHISSYEYVYLPEKDGKRFVEFDQWSQPGDTASRVDDLKSLRDALVASIEVPPAYIGIEENIEAKATLSEQSVVFANTIMHYQKKFAYQLEMLVKKILVVIGTNQDSIPNFKLTFQTPYSLIVEKMANYYDNLSRIIESGKQLDLPKEFILSKYFDIDPSEIEEYKVKEKLLKTLLKKQGSEEGGGGFEPSEEGGEFNF